MFSFQIGSEQKRAPGHERIESRMENVFFFSVAFDNCIRTINREEEVFIIYNVEDSFIVLKMDFITDAVFLFFLSFYLLFSF